MKAVNKAGFTIIEVMLFLGISGLLAAGVLVGTGSSLNSQRYRDSVNSLKTMLQRQYSEVSNVSNDSDNNICNGTSVSRGQSNCVILGRYITTTSENGTTSGNTLSVRQVIGHSTDSTSDSLGDIESLRQYNPSLSSSVVESYSLDWGTLVSKPFSILIVRSPVSGTIKTFIDDSKVVGLSDILDNSNSSINTPASICVDSNGLFTGQKMSIYVNANSSSASGVETKGDDSGC